MKAYCINLDRRPDRWTHISGEAARAGIALQRIAAIDGQLPEIAAAAAAVAPMASGLKMSPGAFACFSSHRKAWEMLLASGDPHALVLEDDLLLADGMAAVLAGNWVPADADVVKLESWGNRAHVAKTPAAAVGRRNVSRLLSSHIGAGCYILSRAHAERLLARTISFHDPVDEMLFNDSLPHFHTATIYQMVPAPAVQGKRTDPRSTPAGWADSSIEARFSAESGHVQTGRESGFERVGRRWREELRARKLGTEYDVIPFG